MRASADHRCEFTRTPGLSPTDNQGVRFCWHDVRQGRSWEEMNEREEPAIAERRQATR